MSVSMMLCIIICFGAYHVWFTDLHNNLFWCPSSLNWFNDVHNSMFWCLCIFHGQSTQEPASIATDELGDLFHFRPQAHTGSCISQINNNYKSRQRIWKQSLSPSTARRPLPPCCAPICCSHCVIVRVIYAHFLALRLVISNRIPTHLVWLQ